MRYSPGLRAPLATVRRHSQALASSPRESRNGGSINGTRSAGTPNSSWRPMISNSISCSGVIVKSAERIWRAERRWKRVASANLVISPDCTCPPKGTEKLRSISWMEAPSIHSAKIAARLHRPQNAISSPTQRRNAWTHGLPKLRGCLTYPNALCARPLTHRGVQTVSFGEHLDQPDQLESCESPGPMSTGSPRSAACSNRMPDWIDRTRAQGV